MATLIFVHRFGSGPSTATLNETQQARLGFTSVLQLLIHIKIRSGPSTATLNETQQARLGSTFVIAYPYQEQNWPSMANQMGPSKDNFSACLF